MPVRKSLITLAGVTLALSLAACSDSTGASDESTTEPATAAAADGACADFFEGTVPLADRAEKDRAALTAGEIADDTAYAEINALESRIDGIVASAEDDVATLLAEVNAPFTEAVERVNAAEPDAEGNVVFPDLSDIDVSASEAAQAELETVCQ